MEEENKSQEFKLKLEIIFNVVLCVVDKHGKDEYWIVARVPKPRQPDTWLFKTRLAALGNRLIFRLENPPPNHDSIPVVAAVGDDGTENKMMLDKLDTEEVGCVYHMVDNYLLYASPTDSAVPRMIGFSEGTTNISFSVDELQHACEINAFYGPESLLSSQLAKMWDFKVDHAHNRNFEKFNRDGDHVFFQRVLQSVLANEVEGDEEMQKLYTHLVIMLRILNSLQKLALIMDEPLNADRRAKLGRFFVFFNKVTIESPSVKENLLRGLKYIGCVYDKFPVPFKSSIFSTAGQYAIHAHVKSFQRIPTAIKFLEVTNPPITCQESSYFGPSNFQFLSLPPHLRSRDGIAIDDFDYDPSPLPEVTAAIKAKSALIKSVPLYGVSQHDIEDIEMAVAIIDMARLADDVRLFENLSNNVRHIVNTLISFRDLTT